MPIAMSSTWCSRGQVLQDRQRLVPLVLGDVRVDRVGRDRLAGLVDDRDLDAGAEAGVEAHGGALARRGGQQQVAQVGGEHVDRLRLGALPQPHPQVDAEVDEDAGAPGPADGVGQPLVGRPAVVHDAEAVGDRLLVGGRQARAGDGVEALVVRVEGEVEDLFLLGPEHRQHAVRLEPAERLGEVEVVAVLLALLRLALADLGDEAALGPHPLAELADQVGVLGEALDQDRAGAVEGGGDVGHVLVEVRLGRLPRVGRRGVEQQVGQRLEAVLAGDLGLGPALGLVGEVEVLQPGLGVGGVDVRPQLVGELALLVDARENRRAPFLELAQVAEALVQRSQLRVVERAGRLLAVPGDERDGGTAVEKVHRGADLVVAHAEFRGDLRHDRPG